MDHNSTVIILRLVLLLALITSTSPYRMVVGVVVMMTSDSLLILMVGLKILHVIKMDKANTSVVHGQMQCSVTINTLSQRFMCQLDPSSIRPMIRPIMRYEMLGNSSLLREMTWFIE